MALSDDSATDDSESEGEDLIRDGEIEDEIQRRNEAVFAQIFSSLQSVIQFKRFKGPDGMTVEHLDLYRDGCFEPFSEMMVEAVKRAYYEGGGI